MKTRFSVLIPVYNRAHFIREAVDSVLAQKFTDFEVIVIDDGSTDQTLNVLKSYGTRIKILHQMNQGPEVARNNGASQANGDYLAFLDSDDIFLPDALQTYELIVRSFNSPPLIIGSITYFSQGKHVEVNHSIPNHIDVLRYDNYLSKDIGIRISNSIIVIRKDLFDNIGGFRNSTSKTFHADDYNLLLKTCIYGPCILVSEPKTVAYRLHDNNSINNVEDVVSGMLSLVDAERQGKYPGGKSCVFSRYARIGGPAYYCCRLALRNNRFKSAYRLIKGTWPMIAAGIEKKIIHLFTRNTPHHILTSRDSTGNI